MQTSAPDLSTGDDSLDALGTWIWDLPEDSVTCSDETAVLLGVSGQIRESIAWFVSRFTPTSRQTLWATLHDSLNQATPFSVELQLPGRDYGAVLACVCGRPFRDSEGQTLWVVGTLGTVAHDADGDHGEPARRAADAPSAWVQPHDRRSAAARYRHVSELI
jgi:hypothetical protein